MALSSKLASDIGKNLPADILNSNLIN